MALRSMTQGMFVAFVSITFTVAAPGISPASNLFPIEPGYDLFRTQPGAVFDGATWQGVPILEFDFGDGNGPVSTGFYDTIVQRKDAVTSAGGQTHLSLVALQLKSMQPIMGNTLFITLNQAKQQLWESDLNNNLMTIGATEFSTTNFKAFFDVRIGSLDGQIIDDPDPDKRSVDLTSSGNPWTNQAPDAAFLINGINYLLNGSDEFGDFWPSEIIHSGPHPVFSSIPEPSTLAMAGLGVFGIAFFRRKRRPTGLAI